MSRRLLVICVAITMVTVFVPVTGATHFSTGYEDTIGTGAEETPNDPSVVGEEIGAEDTPYGVGTETSGCYEAEASVTADEIQDAALSDGFCGQLVYNQGTAYQIISPSDQEILRDDLIGTFDVQRTWFFGGAGLGTCMPICDEQGQNETWNALHTVTEAAGLTDGPEEAHENEDGRANIYNVEIQTAHLNGIVQRNVGIWSMNGWTVPAIGYGGSFVGFLYDASGDVIDDEELDEMLTGLVQAGELSPDTEIGICGYTPDRQFQSTGEQGFCEAPLLYLDGEAESSSSFDGYGDACESPTYVCGATTGGYWESEAVGLAGAYSGRYQGEHTRWHWVIGPNQPECPNMQPGFDFGGDGTGTPFLAHDLDVYVPPQSLSTGPATPSTDNLYSIDDGDDGYANSFTQEVPTVPAVPVDEAVATVDETSQPVRKAELLEPNHVGAESYAIDDDSRTDVVETRTLGQGCSELGLTEDESTNDPWVNYLDSGVSTDRTFTIREPVVEERVAYTKGGVDTRTVGLYGTQDPEHDADNDPTVDLYSTSGNVGVFADKNDDGDYDQVVGPNNAASGFGAGVYSGGNIEAVGAYPMLWDMHVTVEDGEAIVDEESGCSGPSSQPFAETMAQAGYGPNTGLAQAMYLAEPAVFTDTVVTDPQTVPYAEGNNIYVFLNQAARELWDEEIDDGSDDHALSDEVDTLVEELRDFLVAEHDVDAATLDIQQPGVQMEFGSDFNNQCGTDTGGFSLDPSFTHTCETGCEGDTIATMYTFEVDRGDGTIGGGPIPFFNVDGEAHEFGQGVHSWFDLDPFDGDADRNEQRLAPPPTGD